MDGGGGGGPMGVFVVFVEDIWGSSWSSGSGSGPVVMVLVVLGVGFLEGGGPMAVVIVTGMQIATERERERGKTRHKEFSCLMCRAGLKGRGGSGSQWVERD